MVPYTSAWKLVVMDDVLMQKEQKRRVKLIVVKLGRCGGSVVSISDPCPSYPRTLPIQDLSASNQLATNCNWILVINCTNVNKIG